MPRKALEYVNQAAMRAFLSLPQEEQDAFNVDLAAIQIGADPISNVKNVATKVGPGAFELIRNGSPAHRVIVCVKFMETVFVLHAFEKTTNGVDGPNMNTAADRYKKMMDKVNAAKKAAKEAAKHKQGKGKKN